MLTTQSFFDFSDFPDRQLFNPEAMYGNHLMI